MSKKIFSRQSVSLNSPIVKKLGVEETISEITVRRIVGCESKKTVQAFTNERGVITLFEGESYSSDWTEADAVNKLKQLITA